MTPRSNGEIEAFRSEVTALKRQRSDVEERQLSQGQLLKHAGGLSKHLETALPSTVQVKRRQLDTEVL